ncbi:MAG: aldo/keto reductase [Actinobacteria bacterium]|nr:aldo/keto reductase [Actinomycetota bacterium]
MPRRQLGGSGTEVSVLSLGSWKTYERMSRDDGAAVMARARDVGITFFDDARYNDETGRAPIPTGYSEVVFGELFRQTFADRGDAVVANKLWWEFWPEQSAADELAGSLGRLQFDHVDLIYALPPPDDLGIDGAVAEMAGLIEAGTARMWGFANWSADQITYALRVVERTGAPRPCAAQLPYSLVQRNWVESAQMAHNLSEEGIGLVASYSIAGGTLSGKYLTGRAGRASEGPDNPVHVAGKAAAPQLVALATEWHVKPAQLALAFALGHPRLSSLLFGATSPAQIDENVSALDVLASLDPDQIVRLRQVGDEART